MSKRKRLEKVFRAALRFWKKNPSIKPVQKVYIARKRGKLCGLCLMAAASTEILGRPPENEQEVESAVKSGFKLSDAEFDTVVNGFDMSAERCYWSRDPEAFNAARAFSEKVFGGGVKSMKMKEVM